MLTEQQQQAYLARLNYQGSLSPTFETLSCLHLAHLKSIPFENLDIPLGRPIGLSTAVVVNKVLEQHRGGFCYELNYGFSLLLESLGFTTRLLAARVFNGKDYGPAFDHLLLLVILDGENYIADVGFGDSFLTPLKLDRCEVAGYRIVTADKGYILQGGQPAGDWQPQYKFDLHPHEIDEFAPMCQYHQTSPESHFTQKSVCTIATDNGRVTLSNDRLITTINGSKQELHLQSPKDVQSALERYFKIALPDDEAITQLIGN